MGKSNRECEPYFKATSRIARRQGVWITKKVHFYNGPVHRYIIILK